MNTAVMRAPLHTHLFSCLHSCLTLLFPLLSSSSSPSPVCELQAGFNLNRVQAAGDVVLGGSFPVHSVPVFPQLSFASGQQEPACYGWVSPQCKGKPENGILFF